MNVRTLAATLLAVLLLASPVAAHHVFVAEAGTDAEAFATAQLEYAAQLGAVQDAYLLVEGSASGIEALTARNGLEAALVASIDHMAALDVRDCFRLWHVAASGLFEALAVAATEERAGETPNYYTSNGWYRILTSPAFATLFDCTETP
jgi:hypothetical protein